MAEMRLIDANALLNKTRRMYAPDEIDSIAPIATACVTVDNIHRAPTIDAVPLVRCRECKHRACTESTLGFSWCGKFGNVMRDADFCSWGERKMDGGADDAQDA